MSGTLITQPLSFKAAHALQPGGGTLRPNYTSHPKIPMRYLAAQLGEHAHLIQRPQVVQLLQGW